MTVADPNEQAIQVRSSALPAVSAEQMVAALHKYRELQQALDQSMPEQIMRLDGKPFRKKGYWRAIALAFGLKVELVSERRDVAGKFNDGRDNFGYVVSYLAKHPNGREMSGDGACFAVEKARRFKCPHPEAPGSRRTQHFPHNTCPDFDPEFQWRVLPAEATEHNVRGHAHTRAFNRAVSNLVGFGEVSAEEVVEGEVVEAGAAESQSHQPAKPAGQGATEAAAKTSKLPEGVTRVAKVFTKEGGGGDTGKRPWKYYDVKFEDGRQARTFSETDGTHAENAMKSKALVRPKIAASEKGGFDLKGFEPLEPKPAEKKAEPHEAPGHQDEPVSGPEQMLTIRKVTTDAGVRWIIQTDKRQLVTDVGDHANQAVAARNAKKGLVPNFEIMRSPDGAKQVNRLVSFTDPEGQPPPPENFDYSPEKNEQAKAAKGSRKRAAADAPPKPRRQREPGEDG